MPQPWKAQRHKRGHWLQEQIKERDNMIKNGAAYYTVIIPYVADPKIATEWHPTDPTFAPLTRGAFETAQEALVWASIMLGPCSYTNAWSLSYVPSEITACKRCGAYKEFNQVYCGSLCSALAESEARIEARQLNLKGV